MVSCQLIQGTGLINVGGGVGEGNQLTALSHTSLFPEHAARLLNELLTFLNTGYKTSRVFFSGVNSPVCPTVVQTEQLLYRWK